jgi:hypothetical protein
MVVLDLNPPDSNMQCRDAKLVHSPSMPRSRGRTLAAATSTPLPQPMFGKLCIAALQQRNNRQPSRPLPIHPLGGCSLRRCVSGDGREIVFVRWEKGAGRDCRMV